MNLANKISKFNRGRKYNHFLQMIKPGMDDKILDVGLPRIIIAKKLIIWKNIIHTKRILPH